MQHMCIGMEELYTNIEHMRNSMEPCALLKNTETDTEHICTGKEYMCTGREHICTGNKDMCIDI